MLVSLAVSACGTTTTDPPTGTTTTDPPTVTTATDAATSDAGQADPPPGAFESVSAGWWHTCGLRADNRIECWGNNWWGQADPPAGSFTAVHAAEQHTCGLRPDGSIECWGPPFVPSPEFVQWS
ncbi:MAG: RCC1 domain-containing protein [Acidimicrobiaceae bacterium]|nr:RCC1 domain-containing protein [Acidimicrobiaceae bacterium]